MQLPSANCLHSSTSSLGLVPLGASGLELSELNELTVVRELRDESPDDAADVSIPGDVSDRGTGLLGSSVL